MRDISQELLKSKVAYDPDTGRFFRLISKNFYSIKPCGWKNARGYTRVSFGKPSFASHRLAWLYMTGSWPTGSIDHINGDRSDNRWSNLRDVSVSDNAKNQKIKKNNKSGIHGVYFRKGRWHCQIGHKGTLIKIGSYLEFFEACCQRKSAEIQFGFHKNHGRK